MHGEHEQDAKRDHGRVVFCRSRDDVRVRRSRRQVVALSQQGRRESEATQEVVARVPTLLVVVPVKMAATGENWLPPAVREIGL